MTACSFAVSAHVYWNWAARAARTALPRFILGPTLSTCRSLDMRRLGSIRRVCVPGLRARWQPDRRSTLSPLLLSRLAAMLWIFVEVECGTRSHRGAEFLPLHHARPRREPWQNSR